MALDQDIARLRAIDLFNVLETEALRLVAFSAETRILRGGDVLFRLGDPSDGGYVISSGLIASDLTGDGGPANELFGQGALIGANALFAETKRPSTMIAREPSTVLKIPRAVMAKVMENYPDSAARVHALLTRTLLQNRDALRNVEAGLQRPRG